jgi:hypothetical protein
MQQDQPSNQNQPPDSGRIAGLLTAVKGLTFTNVAVIAMLAIVGVPVFIVWKAMNDEALLDRFFSHYREFSSQNVPCAMRNARYRGGDEVWTIGTGIAVTGNDRYVVAVVLDHEPTTEQLASYCETLKLIGDRLQEKS